MKWKIPSQPRSYDMRIISKFLIFPKILKDECRWLEKVKINQTYIQSIKYSRHANRYYSVYEWVDVSFI